MKAEEFDQVFDEGQTNLDSHLDLSTARRPGRDVRRVNVDFPVWMIESLDQEASRLGITRQSVIKTWVAERLDHSSLPKR
jgi:hypothetical protein